jgi:FKBP-type peptidyl-prolyl cis-trans isomerase
MAPSEKKNASPKTLLDMILCAIRNQPPTSSNGVSRNAIAKYLKSEFEYDKPSMLKNALRKAVEKKTLIQTGQSFRVAGDPIPEIPVEAQVKVDDVKLGEGTEAKAGDLVIVSYEGKLKDGTIFDSSKSFQFTLGAGEVIKGWDQGIAGMRVGGTRKLEVPSKLGYGKRGSPPDIPQNADLFFSVTLKTIL